MKPILQHILGLDLGQQADPSALVVLERSVVNLQTSYQCRYLRRWPLGTTYPEIVKEVVQTVRRPELIDPILVVDQTGVGRPVVDLFQMGGKRPLERADHVAEGEHSHLACPCPVKPITITAGFNTTILPDGSIHVPKKDLVGCLITLFGYRRLQIAAGLKDADVLRKELENFKVKVTKAGNETFAAWRDGDHDDIVLSIAISAWVGENCAIGGIPPQPKASRASMDMMPEAVALAGMWNAMGGVNWDGPGEEGDGDDEYLRDW